MPENIISFPEPPKFEAYTTLESPIGTLLIAGNSTEIELVSFVEEGKHIEPNHQPLSSVLKLALEELHGYFQGETSTFSFPLSPKGTDFQQRVWTQLQEIAIGQTCSYKGLSTQLGDLKAIRAVGTANGQNPIAIAIPCHRVIGSDGSLTGYAGGLWRKKWLLEHEQKMVGGAVQLGLF